MTNTRTLQDLSRDEFCNHVCTVLVACSVYERRYSTEYFCELASEAKARGLFAVEEIILKQAAHGCTPFESLLE